MGAKKNDSRPGSGIGGIFIPVGKSTFLLGKLYSGTPGRLYELNKPILSFTQSKSDLKWLIYGLNRNIKASNGISGRLAGG